MGHIRLTVEGQEVKFETPGNDATADEAVLSAIKKAVKLKEDAGSSQLTELKAEHEKELKAVQGEVSSLRKPLEADVVLARTKLFPDLDAEKETAFYAGMSTERLIQEHEHYTAEEIKPATNGDVPEKLSAEEAEMI